MFTREDLRIIRLMEAGNPNHDSKGLFSCGSCGAKFHTKQDAELHRMQPHTVKKYMPKPGVTNRMTPHRIGPIKPMVKIG